MVRLIDSRVPSPLVLVVKNGARMRGIMATGMPIPVSLTATPPPTGSAFRRRLGFRPGQKDQAIAYDDRSELMPVRVSVVARVPMADSVMLTTARAFDAMLWTPDADFEGRAGGQFGRR